MHRRCFNNGCRDYSILEESRAMSIDSKTPHEFDSYAESYAAMLDDPLRRRFSEDPLHFHKRKWALLAKLLVAEGRDPAKMAWLDVGCGQGDLLNLAGGQFAHAVGCDPSNAMIQSACPFEMRKQTSATEIPFANHLFDIVTAVCVYHHVHGHNRDLLTKEVMRVLKPGGLCCLVEHNPWNPVTRSIVKRCPVDVDAELITASEARALFRRHRFDPLRTDYFLYLPESLYRRYCSWEKYLQRMPFGGQYILTMRSPSF
jgi:SAM-dependent methyltransferase